MDGIIDARDRGIREVVRQRKDSFDMDIRSGMNRVYARCLGCCSLIELRYSIHRMQML